MEAQITKELPWFINHTKAEIVMRFSRGHCLDAGCGVGKYFPFFRAKTLIGIDLNVQRLTRIKDEWRKDVQLIAGDVRALPFRDGVFDFIISFEVIEHLSKENGDKLVSELKRVAESKAHIIATTPNCSVPSGLAYHNLLFRTGTIIERFILGRNIPQVYGGEPYDMHLSFYTLRDLADLGFQVYGIGDLGGGLIPINALWRRFPLLRKAFNSFLFNNPMFASHLLGILVKET